MSTRSMSTYLTAKKVIEINQSPVYVYILEETVIFKKRMSCIMYKMVGLKYHKLLMVYTIEMKKRRIQQY
uniref:Uncharacterized protein n=1 Tax=Amphimedon queenslandica TaxID=400682 RepID=A0A1X7UYG6_AMPQE